MKKCLFMISMLLLATACSNKEPIKEIQYITVKDNSDSINYMTQIISLTETNRVLTNKCNVLSDSIDKLNDSINFVSIDYNKLKEDNVVNAYKLERIKYYNDIAKNGNNIKYLRGWINRVLE